MKISLTFILIVFFLSTITWEYKHAQESYNFKNFSEAEKLSNNQITDLYQDSYGFMWIATEDGLNRYDGRNVKTYKNIQGDTLSLPDNHTMQVIEDADNNIWVACFNAIAKLDRKTDKFKKYELDHLSFKSPPSFYSTMLDDQGRIWFSTSELGVIYYDKSTDSFINVGLSEQNNKNIWGEVHVITQLRNGLILAADASDGIKAYNGESNKFDPYYLKPNYTPKRVFHIYEGNDGNIWIAGSGIFVKFSPIQYSVKEIKLLQSSKIKSGYFDHTGIIEDSQGFLWVSVYTHGIFKMDKQLGQITQFVNNPGNLHSLHNNKISSLYKDKYGIMWISYIDGGIAQMDPNSNTFDFNSINLSNRNNNQTTILSLDPSPVSPNEFILGTNSDGILRYNYIIKVLSILDTKDPSVKKDSNNFVGDLAVDYEGNIWYSINRSQLKKYNLVTKKLETIESPHTGKTAQPFRVRSIKISPDNKIWIASNYGIDRYDPVTKKYFSVPRIMNKKMSKELRKGIEQIRESRKPLSSIIEVGEGQNLEKKLSITEEKNILLINVGEGRAIGGMFDRGRIADSEGNTIWEMSDIYETFYNGGGFKNRIGVKALKMEKGEYQLSYYSDLGHSYKNWNTIIPDDSNYWGIEAYEINDNEYEKINSLIDRNINNKNYLPFEYGMTVHFSKTNSSIVWIGTFTNSFFRYDINSNSYTQYNFDDNNLTNASHYIICFYEDLDGIVWVGTYASLVRVDPKTGNLKRFTTDDGIPGGNIFSISEDHNGA
ncbi:MAG: two-component regulator propeller domain-containing protein, partial [Melioribacteraceae bacterium]|nr:two-component regulator propeller domain-containing protein [Melioribacteraceae bacterium]